MEPCWRKYIIGSRTQLLEFSLITLPVLSPSASCVEGSVISQLPTPAAVPCLHDGFYPLELQANISFSLKSLWFIEFFSQKQKSNYYRAQGFTRFIFVSVFWISVIATAGMGYYAWSALLFVVFTTVEDHYYLQRGETECTTARG